MTQKELVGKIKAEIRRRIEEEKHKVVEGTVAFYGARQQVYSSLLSYIESLEKEQLQEPTIKGWVARDKGAKSCCFYFNKPIRHTISWMDERGETGDYDDDYVFLSDLHLDIEDLNWEDEPIEIELTIRKICKD